MSIIVNLTTRLNSRKRSGDWREIARLAGADYNTIARIARGAHLNPGAALVDRLNAAMDTLDRERAAIAAATQAIRSQRP